MYSDSDVGRQADRCALYVRPISCLYTDSPPMQDRNCDLPLYLRCYHLRSLIYLYPVKGREHPRHLCPVGTILIHLDLTRQVHRYRIVYIQDNRITHPFRAIDRHFLPYRVADIQCVHSRLFACNFGFWRGFPTPYESQGQAHDSKAYPIR